MKDKLKEINGRYYQECEVVMLDTDKRSCLFINKRSNQLQYYFKGNAPNNAKHQYLYFLSNEDIKEGDYVIDSMGELFGPYEKGDIIGKEAKKIIATTDIPLQLPQPSKSFIQAYIKAYNEGKPITKVLVEYIYPNTINFGNCIYKEINGDGSYYELINGEVEKTKSLNELINLNAEVNFRLKVNSSNEITIKKIKDSYAREELPSILQSYLDYCLFSGYITPMKFIEENL